MSGAPVSNVKKTNFLAFEMFFSFWYRTVSCYQIVCQKKTIDRDGGKDWS